MAEACLGCRFASEPLIVGTSGRYEFRNKGIDVFIESLKKLAASDKLRREVLAYITVPAGNRGPRPDLQAHLADPAQPIDPAQYAHSTHLLENPAWDPIVNALKDSILTTPESKVKVIFVPTYLNRADGIFDKDYYELLAGMDLTVFPSYYEPWGYTPLESIAFSVPTITTTLAGFGIWAEKHREHAGVEVIRRDDYNDREVEEQIADALVRFAALDDKHVNEVRVSAADLSATALWEHLYPAYEQAYSEAVESSVVRTNRAVLDDGGSKTEQINFVRQQLFVEKPNWNRMMVDKTLPKRLHALEELSRNLWWSWNPGARDLFEGIDPALWAASDRNPIAFLDKLSVERLKELEHDPNFLAQLDAVHTQFRDYMNEKARPEDHDDLLLLDGVRTPFVAEDLFGRSGHPGRRLPQGGFGQERADGRRGPALPLRLLHAAALGPRVRRRPPTKRRTSTSCPISPVRDDAGGWMTVTIAFPGRTLSARVWKCQVGRTDLYLLDADFEANLEEDRQITHYLYGGDWENRLKQEILLGIGGIRALRKLGIRHDVYHCNEGHAAFIGIERIRELINHRKLSFSRGAGGRALVVALHDAYPRTGRPRRLPRVDDPPVHVALSRRAGHHLGAVHQPGQDEPQRPEREVLDVGAGLQPLAGGQRRIVAPRRGIEGHPGQHVARLLQERAPHRLRHQRRALPDVDRHVACAASTPATSPTDSKDTPTTSRHGRRCTTSPTPNCGRERMKLKNKLIRPYPQARTATPARCGSTRRARCSGSSRASSPTC